MKMTKTMLMTIVVKQAGEYDEETYHVEVKRFPFTRFDLKNRLLAQKAYAESLGFKTVDMDHDSLMAIRNDGFITVCYVNVK